MSIDVERIRANYAKMRDVEIERIAKYEVGDFHPSAIDILEDEIEYRQLDPRLMQAIDAQLRQWSDQEIWSLADQVQDLPCPECGRPGRGLHGAFIRRVWSAIIVSRYSRSPMIACADCLRKKRNAALAQNMVFGWWCFPWGLFRTPQTIFTHFRDNGSKRKQTTSDQIVFSFITLNIGEIVMSEDDEQRMTEFVKHRNEYPR